jgi:hypothetical protein
MHIFDFSGINFAHIEIELGRWLRGRNNSASTPLKESEF